MKPLHYIFLFLILILSCKGVERSRVDSLSDEAEQLLHFLHTINGQYTLSGQHNFPSDLDRYTNAAIAVTGKVPVIWGSDFSFMVQGDSAKKYQHCGPMNLSVPFDSCGFNYKSAHEIRTEMINEAIDRHKKGHIITLMWHACFPSQADFCDGESIWTGADKIDSIQWQQLLTDGTELNKMWKKQVDVIATYLKILQQNKVPVLWRPYHEMNGAWFWWGGKPGKNGFQKLWKMMYHYFTHQHKLNNLLWVWNANAIGPWVPAYNEFYPGDAYVDILATDVYRQEYTPESYHDLLNLSANKIVALGEIGEMPTLEQFDRQAYVWFMSWGYYIDQYNSKEEVNAIYNHHRTITLDEMDFSKMTYSLK